MNPIKKVAAIHDLSGYGRTSLIVIIPILSTMGIQVCPFPTAILSNNTGYFEDFSFVDLTDSMEDYMNHWKKEDIEFDCIYSGFLGSERQVDIILGFIETFKTHSNMVVVDPVMGDHGKLYPTIDKGLVQKMKNLVKKADIVIPNYTEALYLLDKEYNTEITVEEVKGMLRDLADLGPKMVVITSVPDMTESGDINVFGYDKENNIFCKVSCKHIPVEFPGTGDSFASVLIGNLLKGDNLAIALDKSVQFIFTGIKESYAYSYPRKEGILLEKILDVLNMPITNSSYELLD